MKTFDPEAHVYRSIHGRLPGATDVIRENGLMDAAWYSEEALWRGKCVHKGVELLVKGTLDWDTVDEKYRGYLESAEKFLAMSGIKVVGSELPCFDIAFAAMPDLWGELNGNVIVELKTGKVPKWAAFQTALQRRALIAEFGFHAVKRFGLQLLPDGKLADLVPFTDSRDDMRAMELVDIFHWKLDNGYLRDWKSKTQEINTWQTR